MPSAFLPAPLDQDSLASFSYHSWLTRFFCCCCCFFVGEEGLLVAVLFLNKKYLLWFWCLAALGNLLSSTGGVRDQYFDGAARSGCPAYPAWVSSSPAAIAHVSWACRDSLPPSSTVCTCWPSARVESDNVALIRLRGVQQQGPEAPVPSVGPRLLWPQMLSISLVWHPSGKHVMPALWNPGEPTPHPANCSL